MGEGLQLVIIRTHTDTGDFMIVQLCVNTNNHVGPSLTRVGMQMWSRQLAEVRTDGGMGPVRAAAAAGVA